MRSMIEAKLTVGSKIISNLLVLKNASLYIQADPPERESRQSEDDISFYNQFWVEVLTLHCLAKFEFWKRNSVLGWAELPSLPAKESKLSL